MDKDFQDRIDEYLVGGNKMSEEEKVEFLKEAKENDEKKEQLEFTRTVIKAIVSRGEKLKDMAEFEKEIRKTKQKNMLLWISGIAATLLVGFFTITTQYSFESTNDNMRGDDDVFKISSPTDSIKNDSIKADTDSIALIHE